MSNEASAALRFQPQLIHTMLRVRDLERALEFYCALLGMQLRRRIEFAEQRYTLLFLGFPGAPPGVSELELRHDWDGGPAWSEGPSAYGHLGIAVTDLSECVEWLRARGVPIRREPGPMRPGGREIALVCDPEGNEIELLAAM